MNSVDTAQTKSPLYLINNRYNSLRKSEKRVAEFVQKHMEEVVVLSLRGLARKCGTSDATVLRFCRSLGYLGFADFKVSLVPELLRSSKKTYPEIREKENSETVKEMLQRNFQQQLDSTLQNCDDAMLTSIALHISQANKILIIGLGGSAGVAYIFCDALGSLGIFSSFLRDRSIIQNVVSTLNSGDVVIGISHSGETEEVVSAVKKARYYGAITIGITNFSPSPLAGVSQFTLVTGVPANLLGSYSCQARISQLGILELVLYELSEILAKKDSSNHRAS
ncbi:MAG: MurR/RpiR family transcriptional regulator [Candidatus Poribacteria bacterium]